MSTPHQDPLDMSDQHQAAAEDSNPTGMAFWHSRIVRSMNAYLIAHPELDVQRWFEEQVSIRTRHASVRQGRRMQRLLRGAGCITLLAGAIEGS